MKRKTVLRSVTASMALLSLTACGIPNLMDAQTAPQTAPNEYPTANVDVATAPDVEPAYYDSGDLYMYTANYSLEAKEGLWMYPDENEDYIQMNTKSIQRLSRTFSRMLQHLLYQLFLLMWIRLPTPI